MSALQRARALARLTKPELVQRLLTAEESLRGAVAVADGLSDPHERIGALHSGIARALGTNQENGSES